MAKRRIVLETETLLVTFNKKANLYTISSKTNLSGTPEGSWDELMLLAKAIINRDDNQEKDR